MAIEKWRYTSMEIFNMVDAAYKACPIVNIRDLKVGDKVLDDHKNALIVTKTFPKRKPVFSGINKTGEAVGDIVKCTQDTYKLITEDLMQYAGDDHTTAVINAVKAGKPVPENVLIQVKGRVMSSLESNKHTVLGHFGQLTFGKPPQVENNILFPGGKRDYYDLISNSNYATWFSMLCEGSKKIVNRVNDEIAVYDEFLKLIS